MIGSRERRDSFAETAEPEEGIAVLRSVYAALGPLVGRFEGTLDKFSGDGLLVFFNDPLPCPDPAERAVRMACAMRGVVAALAAGWRRRGFALGFGVGIAQGYATIGRIGFAERIDYPRSAPSPTSPRGCARRRKTGRS